MRPLRPVSARFAVFQLLACTGLFSSDTLAGLGARKIGQGAVASSSDTRNLKFAESYGRLPLAFEPNNGQAEPEAQFVARGKGYGLSLQGDQAVLALEYPDKNGRDECRTESSPVEVLRMRLLGAELSAKGRGLGRLPGISKGVFLPRSGPIKLSMAAEPMMLL